MEKIYQIAVVGFGGMGGNHVKQLAKGNVRARVCGIFDIDPARAQAAREQSLSVYPTLEAVLADPKVDVVVVAVPNDRHREIAIAALRAGKHVLCEKPAAVHAWELEEMMTVAAECGRLLTIDQNRRVNRDYVLMRREVESGVIGTPYLIESRVEGSRGMPAGWRTSKAQGGGMMLDWGVHLIDQLLYMNPSPVMEVYCRMHSLRYAEVDDNFHLRLRFADGLDAIVEVATNHFIKHPRWLVYGTEGSLQIDDWDCTGRVVKCLSREDTWATEIRADKAGPSKTMAARSPDSVEIRELSAPSDVVDNIDPTYVQLIDAIEEKAELTIKPAEALRVMKVMEAALASWEEHKVIQVEI